MKTEQFTLEGFGGQLLPAYLWLPEGEVKCVLQITHGMTEHMGRYQRFAEDLTRQGVAVAGFDLRGHGRNGGDPQVASLGQGGWAASIADMRLFFRLLSQRFAQLPHYMLGFSLGSFLLREYLQTDSTGVAGAIIVGTGHQPAWLLSLMMGIVKGQIQKSGFDGTTDLVRRLSFGTYNQACQPNRTDADWLCSDAGELDAYLADPLVRRDISAGLFWELLGAMKRTAGVDAYTTWNKDLPVLLLYGREDPVGDGGKGVQRVYDRMQKAGMRQVDFLGVLDARHDVFHEETSGAAEMVRHEIADWLAYT